MERGLNLFVAELGGGLLSGLKYINTGPPTVRSINYDLLLCLTLIYMPQSYCPAPCL